MHCRTVEQRSMPTTYWMLNRIRRGNSLRSSLEKSSRTSRISKLKRIVCASMLSDRTSESLIVRSCNVKRKSRWVCILVRIRREALITNTVNVIIINIRGIYKRIKHRTICNTSVVLNKDCRCITETHERWSEGLTELQYCANYY